MNTYFNEIKKNFGFGCMRLPMNSEEVDYELTSKMLIISFNKDLIILIQPMVI